MEKSKFVEISDIGLKPISKESPVGEPISMDDSNIYLLDQEIKQLQLTPAGDVNWGLVKEISINFLCSTSKDLKIACYLSFALYKEFQMEGLATGFKILNDMIENYWDTFYPEIKRIRRRRNVLEWLFVNINKNLTNSNLEDSKNLQICSNLASDINDRLSQLIGESIKPINDLSNKFSTQINYIKVVPIKEEINDNIEEPVKQLLSPNTQIQIISSEEAEVALQNALVTVKKTSLFLEETGNFTYFRLVRIATWFLIQNLPVHNNFVTLIPGIESSTIKQLDQLENTGNWEQLLSESESYFIEMPFWLDLQRYSSAAFKHMGAEYIEGNQIIQSETLALIRRFPEVINLKFSNKASFASEKTKQWINEISINTDAEQKKVTSDSVNENKNDSDESIFVKIHNLLIKKQFQDAIILWENECLDRNSAENNFQARFQLAKLLLSTGNSEHATFQLEILDDEIKRFNLEEWNPKLSTEIIKTLLTEVCKANNSSSSEHLNKIYLLKKRLHKLDIITATTC